MHCAKNNLNQYIKIQPVTAGCNGICPAFLYIQYGICLAHKPDIPFSIGASASAFWDSVAELYARAKCLGTLHKPIKRSDKTSEISIF